MRVSICSMIGLLALAGACGDGSGDGSFDGLLVDDVDPAAAEPALAGPIVATPAGAELEVEDLACPHGGKVGKIAVAFDCGEITVVSCKDLSNVVIELADGSRKRFEGLSGQRGVFSDDGVQIVGVWVKAGANHSGDGPGYGERFDAPAQVCPPPGETCFVADGTCRDVPPPPPPDEDCFVADGVCGQPPAPPPPAKVPQDSKPVY